MTFISTALPPASINTHTQIANPSSTPACFGHMTHVPLKFCSKREKQRRKNHAKIAEHGLLKLSLRFNDAVNVELIRSGFVIPSALG